MRIGDRVCGRVTSGGLGYTTGSSIAYAYLPVDEAKPGTEIAVNVFGDWVPGVVADQPLYDAKSTRVLADG